jgi:hypothetical protein
MPCAVKSSFETGCNTVYVHRTYINKNAQNSVTLGNLEKIVESREKKIAQLKYFLLLSLSTVQLC